MFAVVRLTVDVHFSAELIKSNDSHICFNIIFSWMPLLTVDGKSDLLLRGNVTALTWNCNISYMGPTTHDVQQGFIKVDGNPTVLRFLPSANMYSGLLSGTDYLFWLSVGTQLSNGTFLHFESTATELEIPLCEGEMGDCNSLIVGKCFMFPLPCNLNSILKFIQTVYSSVIA